MKSSCCTRAPGPVNGESALLSTGGPGSLSREGQAAWDESWGLVVYLHEKCGAEGRQRGSGGKRNILPPGEHSQPAGSLRDEHFQMCSGSCGLAIGLREGGVLPAGPRMFGDGHLSTVSKGARLQDPCRPDSTDASPRAFPGLTPALCA